MKHTTVNKNTNKKYTHKTIKISSHKSTTHKNQKFKLKIKRQFSIAKHNKTTIINIKTDTKLDSTTKIAQSILPKKSHSKITNT